jgi:hypothetical protein
MAKFETVKVEKAGKTLTCKHCDGEKFLVHEVKIKSAWMPLIDNDWLSEFAEINICAACGYVHWFTVVPSDFKQMRIPCPKCSELILSTRSYCPHCDADLAEKKEADEKKDTED